MSAVRRDTGGMRLMELHALALEDGLDAGAVDAAMDGDDPRAALLALLQPHRPPAMNAAEAPSSMRRRSRRRWRTTARGSARRRTTRSTAP